MIDPSLRAVLRSRYTIRRFFISFSSLLAVLMLLLLVISAYVPADSTLREAIINFLGNFAANVAIFLCTYAFYVFITSPELRNAEVIPLRNVEIGEEIIDLPAAASDYWFWGRTGSYFRKDVLPRLDRLAHEERKRVRIRVVIPDPDRDGNSQLYMHFKRGLGEEANEHTLAANVIFTIARLVSTSMRNPYLAIEIGLCPTVPVLMGAFFLWRRSKAEESAKVANARLHRDTLLYEHIKAGKREYDWRRRDESIQARKDGELVFETAHMAAYNVSHFAESRIGFYFKDIDEYGLYGFFAGEPGEYYDSYYRTDSTFKEEGRLLTRHDD
ncbi:hypothetical protein [Bradyrhizobium pachyrhizi]|uniref:hypothetical protein n=1 Tax=Bradyrhizobium pachyrhizi TaxID=280333 RepID=UPI003D36ADB0